LLDILLLDILFPPGAKLKYAGISCVPERCPMTLLRRTFPCTLCFLAVIKFATAQIAAQQPAASAPNNPGNTSQATEPVVTLKTATRMVTIEVVVRDRQGHPVPGLSAKDFQLFEQIPPKNDQHLQTISAFQAVTLEGIRAASKGLPQMPPGVHSNLVDMQKMSAPPTVLLIDGLNTSVTSQMQIHHQMVKMLYALPPDVPTAVFLMDHSLHFLQGFTTDPKLLRAAVSKALSLDTTLQVADARDDPNSASSVTEDIARDIPLSPNTLAIVQTFDREIFSATMDIRVRETLDALNGIARYLSGYPGRKNLLWVSSSFPVMIAPDSDTKFSGMRVYEGQMSDVAHALAGSSVAVYPMDPLGLSASTNFDVSKRLSANQAGPGRGFGQSVMREANNWDTSHDSMRLLAEESGGRICVNNNDLVDCVKTAVNDGLSYYQLAYYPDKGDWHGEFHRVIVKTSVGGVHLAYREGYYAKAEGDASANDKDALARSEAELQGAACGDLVGATSILVMAQAMPPEQPGQARFFMAIDPTTITFPSSPTGDRNLQLTFAFCTFDNTGKPLQYSFQNVDQKLTTQEYTAVSTHGISHPLVFSPNPAAVRVRLLVRDRVSGHMGGVDLPYAAPAVAPAAASGDAARPAPPSQH